MNKPYLLTAGVSYYPCQGDGDWVACFKTEEEAEAAFFALDAKEETYDKYDWHEIIDLRKWTE